MPVMLEKSWIVFLAKQHVVEGMPTIFEMQARMLVVSTSVEAAITAGNSLARHQIVLSKDFDRMMDCLHQAAEILDRMTVEHEASVVVKLPLRSPTLKLLWSARDVPGPEGSV